MIMIDYSQSDTKATSEVDSPVEKSPVVAPGISTGDIRNGLQPASETRRTSRDARPATKKVEQGANKGTLFSCMCLVHLILVLF